MTREEWKCRAAARYAAQLGVSQSEAEQMAVALFDAQEGGFDSSADYNPETCVDEEIAA